MSENQTSAKSTVEGELGLDDLEKIAGGTDVFASTKNVFDNDDTGLPKQDNVFTAYDGAKGTSLDNDYSKHKPLVLTVPFP